LIKKLLSLIVAVFFLAPFFSTNAFAGCGGSALGNPDNVSGQNFTCSDGSTYNYKRKSIGSTIKNNETGEIYKGSSSSDPSGVLGQEFKGSSGALRLKEKKNSGAYTIQTHEKRVRYQSEIGADDNRPFHPEFDLMTEKYNRLFENQRRAIAEFLRKHSGPKSKY